VTESGRKKRKEREEKRRGGEKSEKKKRKKTTGGKKVKNSHQHVAPHFEHVSGVPRHEDAEAHHRRSHHPHGDGMVLVAFPPGLVGDAGDALSWSFFFLKRGEFFLVFFSPSVSLPLCPLSFASLPQI
jgi:hypothetical protein